jgi:hypothetical protein
MSRAICSAETARSSRAAAQCARPSPARRPTPSHPPGASVRPQRTKPNRQIPIDQKPRSPSRGFLPWRLPDAGPSVRHLSQNDRHPKPLYGAILVKSVPGSFPHLLVRPIGDHLLVPTFLRGGAARSDRQGWGRRPIAQRLVLDGHEHGGRLHWLGKSFPAVRANDDNSEGSSPSADAGRATTLYSVDP